MSALLRRAFDNLTGEWQLNLENRVPPKELYKARIASSKPSLGFFVLLICSAVIATLGLISNSTAVVIGAMIVAPLMDPILSLAFGLSIADNRLVKRSAITVIIGIATVVCTAWLLALTFDASEVNREMTARTAPNLIDLVIAVAAAIAGAFTITRDKLSNSIAGVAIAVALVPPLCVTGIGLSLGPELVAVFGRGTIDMVLNVPTKLVGKLGLEEVQDNMRRRAMNDYGIKEVEINISVIPTQILRYSPEAAPTP